MAGSEEGKGMLDLAGGTGEVALKAAERGEAGEEEEDAGDDGGEGGDERGEPLARFAGCQA